MLIIELTLTRSDKLWKRRTFTLGLPNGATDVQMVALAECYLANNETEKNNMTHMRIRRWVPAGQAVVVFEKDLV